MDTQITETMLIIDYTADWARQFDQLKKVLESALSVIHIGIVHIGSTSVPGLGSKAIIDIDIIYKEGHEYELIKQSLEDIGYRHHGNQGIEGREVFKRTGETQQAVLDTIAHHLYVCRIDSGELRRHLLFKECLLTNEVARNFYGQLKQQLAEEAKQDRKFYAQLKTQKANDFITECVEKTDKDDILSQILNRHRS